MSSEAAFEIYNLYGEYTDAIFKRDTTQLKSTWAEKARWVVHFDNRNILELEGRDKIVSTWFELMSNFQDIHHVGHSPRINFNTDPISARWYTSEHLLHTTGEGRYVYGIYDDKMILENDKWVYAERVFTSLYNASVALDGDSFTHPDLR